MATLIGLIELFREMHLLLVPHPAFAPGTLWLLIGFLLLNLLVLLEVADRLSLKNDLEIARQIQQAMLPRGAFQAAGLEAFGMTRPANTVGGDFYDILPLPDGRVLLALGDVAGKGSPAALLMALLLAMMRTLVDEGCEGADLASRLNTQIVKHAPGSRFVTLFVAVLDPVTGDLRYVNAGQNPPLLRRVAGNYEQLRDGGMALGMFEEATYTEGHTMLARRRRDRDVQRRRHRGRGRAGTAVRRGRRAAHRRSAEAGHRRKELGWALFAAVQVHTEERRLLDDLTVLVARRLPPLPAGISELASQALLVSASHASDSSTMARALLLVACLVGAAAPVGRTGPPRPPTRWRRSSPASSRCWCAATAASSPRSSARAWRRPASAATRSTSSWPDAVKAVVRERDRAPLEGVPPGDGFRAGRRVLRRHARAGPAFSPPAWTCGGRRAAPCHRGASSMLEGLSSVDGLYRLRLDTDAAARRQGVQGDLGGSRRVARRGHASSPSRATKA